MGDSAAVDTLAWGDSAAVDILVFQVDVLGFQVDILGFQVDILVFQVDILVFPVDILVFQVDILVFQVDILVFPVDILVFQVDILVFQADIVSFPEGVPGFPESIEIWSLFPAVAFTMVGNTSLQAAITPLVLTIVSLMAIAIAMTTSFTIETVFSLDLTSVRSDFRIGGTRGTQTMDILTTTTIPTTRRSMIIGIGAV
jgi:hypothetical protein